jgi:hypothetical protein
LIRKRLSNSELLNVWIVDGVIDDRLKADRYFCRVDLEMRKWWATCVLVNPEQVARISNCLILAGDKEGVGIESHHGG